MFGFICFGSSHYTCFFKQKDQKDKSDVWIYYDDTSLKKFTNWKEIINQILRLQFHPIALFYREVTKTEFQKLPVNRIEDEKCHEFLLKCQSADKENLERKKSQARAQSIQKTNVGKDLLTKIDNGGDNSGSSSSLKIIKTDDQNSNMIKSYVKNSNSTSFTQSKREDSKDNEFEVEEKKKKNDESSNGLGAGKKIQNQIPLKNNLLDEYNKEYEERQQSKILQNKKNETETENTLLEEKNKSIDEAENGNGLMKQKQDGNSNNIKDKYQNNNEIHTDDKKISDEVWFCEDDKCKVENKQPAYYCRSKLTLNLFIKSVKRLTTMLKL